MKKRFAFTIGFIVCLTTSCWNVASAFTFIRTVTVPASVTVSSTPALTILASPLSTEAFFGTNVVIPVKVISPNINPVGLQVRISFSLFDVTGNSVGLGVVGLPITMTRDPARTDTLVGGAVIPRSDLLPIEHGGRLDYMFQAIQNGAGAVNGFHGPAAGPGAPLNTLPDPYQTTIINQVCSAVGPAGGRVSAPDLSVSDGRTAVTVAPGAVPAPGTLCIRTNDPIALPAGPGGAKAAAVYSIDLQDTALAGTAELVLTYPADATGKVLTLGADPGSLGLYWLDQTNGALLSGKWRPLSRVTIDTTLHTVTGMTSHFSTFALFAAGAISAPGLRPSERIITPNGDGINDTVLFSGLTAQESVQLFDVRGRRVRSLTGPSPLWDGKDDDGQTVESGVYLYQYESQGERVSGVIAVAK